MLTKELVYNYLHIMAAGDGALSWYGPKIIEKVTCFNGLTQIPNQIDLWYYTLQNC